MKKKEKKQIITFARNAFRQFYNTNYIFLSGPDYKPGKRTYRNLLSLNKMMDEFLRSSDPNYVVRAIVKKHKGWSGPSSYVQHERIITNFDLSTTAWDDKDRSVLELNDEGIVLRKKYKKYLEVNPNTDLNTLKELPQFAINFFIDKIRNTDSTNMTLWKNTIITALYLYCELGYMPAVSTLTDREKRALISCCNYVDKDGVSLMDPTYLTQPIAMLKNVNLLDTNNTLTETGYKLLKEMKMFTEVGVGVTDFEETLAADLNDVEEILESKRMLKQEAAPARRSGKVVTTTQQKTGPKNVNFEKVDKENKLTGNLGEQLVLEYERARLAKAGIENVEEVVFLTSEKQKEYGNAYPCDVISFDEVTGKQLFIEVKTTKGKAETPFYISAEELKFSIDNSEQFRLYRVYNLFKRNSPEFYITQGRVDENFNLEYDRYIATR